MTGGTKQHLWRGLRIVGGVVAALVVVVGVLLFFAGRYVTAQRLVDEVEDSLNCRMEIGEVRVQALRMPSLVVLRGVRLGERDGWVGKPLAERPRMEKAAVEVEEVRLAVSLGALLVRRIDVQELFLGAPRVEMVLAEDGSNNLDELFRSAPDREERRRREGRKPSKSLNAEEVGMLASLDGVGLSAGQVDLHIEKTGLLIEVRGLAAELGSIEVDPAALESTNEAQLQLRGEATLVWNGTERRIGGHFSIEAGTANVRLFDPATADLDLDVTGRFVLGAETYLSTNLPPINRTWERIGVLSDLGMRIGGLPERATFGRGATVGLHYHRDRVTVLDPLSLWVGDWEVAVLEESWLDLASEEHVIDGEVIASEGVSGLLGAGLGLGLELVPEALRADAAAELDSAWFQDGRLVARIRSSGELSDPEVEMLNKIPEWEERAKDALKELGESLLERLREE